MVQVPYPEDEDEIKYYYEVTKSSHISTGTTTKIQRNTDRNVYTEIIKDNCKPYRVRKHKSKSTHDAEMVTVHNTGYTYYYLTILMICCATWVIIMILNRLEQIILFVFGTE